MALLYLSIVLVLLFLAVTFVVYLIIFRTPAIPFLDRDYGASRDQYSEWKEETRKLREELAGRDYEDVRIESYDSLTLAGKVYRGKSGSPWCILVHGYRGLADRDFCGGIQLPLERGWNALLIDMRGHGGSDGHTITFGIKEKRDVVSWVEWIRRENGPGTPVFLFGISMGAATVLMVSGMLTKKEIRGIIADCPYSSPVEIIAKCGENVKLPRWLVVPLSRSAARIWGGFSLSSPSAADSVAQSDIPCLIVHGLDDRFVPDAMSREIEKANPALVRYEEFPDAGHGLSFMVDRSRYKRVAGEFLDSLIPS